MAELPQLDPVVHGKLRLAVLSLLSGVEGAEFIWLRDKTGSTDGNIGAHLLKLEEAGYIVSKKKFVQRKPVTLYHMTEAGRFDGLHSRTARVAGSRDKRIIFWQTTLYCRALCLDANIQPDTRSYYDLLPFHLPFHHACPVPAHLRGRPRN
jgi:DNA-binding transcriptional ArsR family regulator